MSNENWNQNPNDPNAQRPWGSSWDAVGQPGGSQPEQPEGASGAPQGSPGPQPGPQASQPGAPLSQPSASQPTPAGWENSGWGAPPQGQWQTGWNASTQYPEQQQRPPQGWQQQPPTGQGVAGGQWAPVPARAPRGEGAFVQFFRALFDFDFRRYVTPQIVRILYILSIVAVGLYWIGSVFVLFASARSTSVFTGTETTNGGVVFLAVLDLLFGWIFALAVIALIRMQYEFMTAMIRTSEYARDIHAHLGAGEAPDRADGTDSKP